MGLAFGVLPGHAAQALTVNVDAAPEQVASGEASTLTWSSSGAKWCYASVGWGGSRGLSGSHSTGPLWKNRSYKITCSDGSSKVSDSVTVAIGTSGTGDELAVDLDASPRSIAKGNSSSLKWSSSGAASCTASGGWSGNRPASGTFETGSLSETTSYSLTCTNGNQSALASVNVQVDAVPVVHWHAPTENVDGTALTDLAGYRLYWGTRSRDYTGNARINSAYWTQYNPHHLPSGTYFVAVTALDEQGNESDYSNEVKILVP